jgi:hypothetical protein
MKIREETSMKSVLKREKTLAFFFALILVFNLVIANPLFSFKSSASMETETESQSEGFEFGNANTYFDMERAIKPGGSMTFEAVTTLPENSRGSSGILSSYPAADTTSPMRLAATFACGIITITKAAFIMLVITRVTYWMTAKISPAETALTPVSILKAPT